MMYCNTCNAERESPYHNHCPYCGEAYPEESEPKPVDDHWDCGICGCSHRTYEEAMNCKHRNG